MKVRVHFRVRARLGLERVCGVVVVLSCRVFVLSCLVFVLFLSCLCLVFVLSCLCLVFVWFLILLFSWFLAFVSRNVLR